MINFKKRAFAAAIAAVAMSVAAPSPAAAQIIEYATKVVCGQAGHTYVAAPGNYFTGVNVHNPGDTVTFRWKVAVAFINTAGPVSGFNTPMLRNDEALDIECRIMRAQLVAGGFTVPTFFTGFLVIQSPSELDVVAVYTAHATNGQVSSIHTERVPPRRL